MQKGKEETAFLSLMDPDLIMSEENVSLKFLESV